ncbi:MAG: hypothetical protein ACT4OJ_06395 [Bacteroidota bacterium]
MAYLRYHTENLMKKPFILAALFTLLTSTVFSQQVIRHQSCSNESIGKQADSLRELYTKDGYILVREASMTMESEYEMPVIVPLTQGSWYQFVFIGDYSSRLYEVRMYDWQERMVIYRQKRWGDVDGNVISYTYIPKFSEFHMIKPVQVNKQKKKNLCGYVMMFKRTGDQQPTGTVTVTGRTP